MYKIYINEKPLILISTEEISKFDKKPGVLLTRYPGKPKFLLNYIDMMEKGMKFDELVLYSDDVKKLYNDLKTIAPPIKAAGGIVFNDNKELLVIFRKGFWDLAKGHLHKNETKKDAAAREVMEETGLSKVEVFEKAGKTRHIFKNKSRHMKISHWYFMTANQIELTPQTEEDIMEAKWVKLADFMVNYSMYASIRDLLERVVGRTRKPKHSEGL